MVRAGDRLGERYQVIEPLASGGMGTLWRAHHLELGVDVALKLVTEQSATPLTLQRFKREAQAAAKLRSPHIVQVLDFGEHEGQPYLAMELLKGEDLCARLARSGRLPPARCAEIIDGVAKAVQLAHAAGIVHRDLKPANIFLERVGDDEVVKVLDFGIAKELAPGSEMASTTGAGLIGSPSYMSPEQAWGQSVGPASDIWALGVVALELLTGTNPFCDESLAKVFARILRDPLPVASRLNPALPAAVDRFFERALARAPSERIASAKELAEAFRAAIRACEVPAQKARDAFVTTLAEASAAPDAPRAQGMGGSLARARARFWLLTAVALVVVAGLAAELTRRVQRGSPDAGAAGSAQVATLPAEAANLPSAIASSDAGAAQVSAPPAPAVETRPTPAAPIGSVPAVARRAREKRAVASEPEPSSAASRAAPAPQDDAKFGILPPQRDPKFGIPLGP